MKKNKVWIFIFLLPALIIFACIFLYPIIMVFTTSLFEWKGFSGDMNFIGIANYVKMFTDDKIFTTAFSNTLIWVLLQSTFHVVLGVILALILAKKPFGWRTVRTSYMLPNIISLAVLAIVFFNVFSPERGLLNVVLRAIGVENAYQNWYFDTNTAFGTVTFTWLMYAGLIVILVMSEIGAISDDIYEAARIDGASGFQIDIKIKLPLLRNVIGTGVILAATSMLKEFELIYLTTNGGPGYDTMNLPLYTYKTSLLENNFGYANAVSSVTILMGIVIIFLASRIFSTDKSDM